MEPIYREKFKLYGNDCDCHGRVKPSALLGILQEVAGAQCTDLHMSWEEMAAKNLFWAITRQSLQITRLPRAYETITIETWPVPASRVAYPRSTIGYDEQGNELFRCMALWVLMDLQNRSMILPGKSGIDVPGHVRGLELPAPKSLSPLVLAMNHDRIVRFNQLDRNGHMNNTRYLDWVMDLLPASFHAEHPLRDFTVCYLSEAREGERITLHYELSGDGILNVNATRPDPMDPAKTHRVFALRAAFE